MSFIYVVVQRGYLAGRTQAPTGLKPVFASGFLDADRGGDNVISDEAVPDRFRVPNAAGANGSFSWPMVRIS